ncbi:hypothetical protein V6N12_044132 [Hibiscus sabdariffa]
MAIAVNFSAQSLRQSAVPRAMADLALNPLTFQTSHQLEQKGTKKQLHGVAIKRQESNKLTNNHRVSLIVLASNSDSISILGQPSATDTIKHFYTCINERNLKKLGGFISEDCYIEDCSFFNPFNGKKEVMHFFDLLMRSMGQNVKFIIEHVCEGDGITVGVNWHLEWKQTQIPFTRGCSFYECSEEREILVIKKARTIIESPLKPGGVVLVLLKNVTTIFDEFPKAAEWFLKSPHVIIQSLMKIYAMFLAPLINPLVASYVRIWEFMARLFALAIKIEIVVLLGIGDMRSGVVDSLKWIAGPNGMYNAKFFYESSSAIGDYSNGLQSVNLYVLLQAVDLLLFPVMKFLEEQWLLSGSYSELHLMVIQGT